jgi:ethanolamine utilization microcompartment shell protein EutS
MAKSGQITVTTAGTPVTGDDEVCVGDVYIAPMPTNTGAYVLVGDVGSSEKYAIPAGNQIVVKVGNLNELEFDVATNGDKICFLKYF